LRSLRLNNIDNPVALNDDIAMEPGLPRAINDKSILDYRHR
jgi:hypothetical protein